MTQEEWPANSPYPGAHSFEVSVKSDGKEEVAIKDAEGYVTQNRSADTVAETLGVQVPQERPSPDSSRYVLDRWKETPEQRLKVYERSAGGQLEGVWHNGELQSGWRVTGEAGGFGDKTSLEIISPSGEYKYVPPELLMNWIKQAKAEAALTSLDPAEKWKMQRIDDNYRVHIINEAGVTRGVDLDAWHQYELARRASEARSLSDESHKPETQTARPRADQLHGKRHSKGKRLAKEGRGNRSKVSSVSPEESGQSNSTRDSQAETNDEADRTPTKVFNDVDPRIVIELKSRLNQKLLGLKEVEPSMRKIMAIYEATRYLLAQGTPIEENGNFVPKGMETLRKISKMMDLPDDTLNDLASKKTDVAPVVPRPDYTQIDDFINRRKEANLKRLEDLNAPPKIDLSNLKQIKPELKIPDQLKQTPAMANQLMRAGIDKTKQNLGGLNEYRKRLGDEAGQAATIMGEMLEEAKPNVSLPRIPTELARQRIRQIKDVVGGYNYSKLSPMPTLKKAYRFFDSTVDKFKDDWDSEDARLHRRAALGWIGGALATTGTSYIGVNKDILPQLMPHKVYTGEHFIRREDGEEYYIKQIAPLSERGESQVALYRLKDNQFFGNIRQSLLEADLAQGGKFWRRAKIDE